MRYTLVDGQGNFGSVDGDSAAAMRYTEIRMEKISHEMLADLEKETVDFVDNYDGTEKIPEVLPTRVPNLLVNGSSGIAVGMATNIPPHNLSEVVKGCIALIDNQELTVDELLERAAKPGCEAALSGTAAVLAPVGTLIHQGKELKVGTGNVGPTTVKLREALNNIQWGKAEDKFGWLTDVK